MMSLYEIKNILSPQKVTNPQDDVRIIQSWTEYEDNPRVSPEERNLEYMCYELEVMNPETGEITRFYKALKFARVIRLPADAKQSTSFMDKQQGVLSGVSERKYNFVTIIANMINPVPIGLLFLYGVQGVATSIGEAKRSCHEDFLGFIGMMQGTFKVLELKCLEAREAEWLREKMSGMEYLTMVRGIPFASKAGEDAGNKGVGNKNINPDSEGTLEELITGMADFEYVIEILSTPVYTETLEAWQLKAQNEMTAWNSQLQGQSSLSFNLSIPMMYMANSSQSEGWNRAFTDGKTISHAQSESFTATEGESVGRALSHSYSESQSSGVSESFGEGESYSHGNSISQSETYGFSHSSGVSVGHSVGSSEGYAYGRSNNQSFGNSVGVSENVSFGRSEGSSENVSFGRSVGNSENVSVGHSEGTSENISVGHSTGSSENTSYGHTEGRSENFNESIGLSSTSGSTQTVSHSKSQSVSQSQGTTLGQTYGQSSSHNITNSESVTDSHGISNSSNIGYSTGTSRGETESRNLTEQNSDSKSISHGTNNSTSNAFSSGTNFSFSGSTTEGRTSSKSDTYTDTDTESANGGLNLKFLNIGGSKSSSEGYSDGYSSSRNTSTTTGSSHGMTYSDSGSQSMGESQSVTSGATHGNSTSHGNSYSQNLSNSETYSSGTSESYSQSNGKSFSEGFGVTESESISASQSESVSIGNGVTDGESYSVSQSAGNSYSRGQSYGTNVSDSRGYSKGTNVSDSISYSEGRNVSDSNSYSMGSNESESSSYGAGINQSESSSYGMGSNLTQNQSEGSGESLTINASRSVSDSISNSSTDSVSKTLGSTYGQNYSESVSASHSMGTNESVSTGKTEGYSDSNTTSKSVSNGTSQSDTYGTSQSLSRGVSRATMSGTASSMGLGPSIGYSKSHQWLDQGVKDLLELMSYQNERIKKALRGQGAFYTYVYIACPNPDSLATAQAVAKSTWQNEYTMTQPLQVLDLTETEQKHLLYHFSAFSADVTKEDVYGVEEYKYCTVLLPEEFVAYTHLPRVSEGGVYSTIQDIPKFASPSMTQGEIHMGTVLNSERFTFNNGYRTQSDYRISEDKLMHGFFAGASRSGKTEAAKKFVYGLTKVRRKRTGKRLRIVGMDPKMDWRVLARYVEPERFNFYSLGNVNFCPLKLNIWKVPKGVWPQIWIDGVIDIYCRAYGLLERGKQMIANVVYSLYEEAGVFDACNNENWRDEVPVLSAHVNFIDIYKRMVKHKCDAENGPMGRAGNDTRDAYARLIERLSCFSRPYSIEAQLYGTSEGIGVDELIGEDDVTILESKGLENTFKNFIFGAITSGFYKYAVAHEGGYLAEDQYETVLVLEEANEVLLGNDKAGSDNQTASLPGSSEFELILDQAAGYGLFIIAITQKIADMPKSVIANSGLIFAGRMATAKDIEVTSVALGREQRIDDRDIVKWLPRSNIGWFLCKTARVNNFKDAEPVLVEIERLEGTTPTNREIEEILAEKKAGKLLVG